MLLLLLLMLDGLTLLHQAETPRCSKQWGEGLFLEPELFGWLAPIYVHIHLQTRGILCMCVVESTGGERQHLMGGSRC